MWWGGVGEGGDQEGRGRCPIWDGVATRRVPGCPKVLKSCLLGFPVLKSLISLYYVLNCGIKMFTNKVVT